MRKLYCSFLAYVGKINPISKISLKIGLSISLAIGIAALLTLIFSGWIPGDPVKIQMAQTLFGSCVNFLAAAVIPSMMGDLILKRRFGSDSDIT